MPWLLPLIVFMCVGIGTTIYFRTRHLRREQTAAGIVALAGTSWRDFIHLVLDALHKRGYEREFDRASPTGDEEYMLRHGDERVLLSCKHGSAFVLGIAPVHELSKAMQLAGADKGLLVTQGSFSSDARKSALAHGIELLDGETLWPELAPLLSADKLHGLVGEAQRKTRQRVVLGWGLAAVAALATYMLMPRRDSATATPASTAPAAATPAATTTRQEDTNMANDVLEIPSDPVVLGKRRSDVIAAISTLPRVDRALWSTESTLLVHLSDADVDPKAGICGLLQRYPELRTSRLQLQPPPGSDKPVRFLQCQTY